MKKLFYAMHALGLSKTTSKRSYNQKNFNPNTAPTHSKIPLPLPGKPRQRQRTSNPPTSSLHIPPDPRKQPVGAIEQVHSLLVTGLVLGLLVERVHQAHRSRLAAHFLNDAVHR